MMLTVHGLPNKTKFQDVKALINQECNIPDFILDHLVDDGYDSKKVRIGLTTESDGYRLMKCLEGFRMSGSHVLKVVPVGKTPQPQPDFNPRSSYNHHRNDYPNQSREYQNDYNRGQPSTSSSQISPIGSKNSRQPDRHKGNHDRGLQDARQSLSLAMAEPRLDRYQGSSDRRPAPEQRALETQSSDFRDPSRGPLAPPSIRPASLDSRLNEARNQRGNQDTGILGSVRGQENHNNQGQDQPNPVPTNRQSQWNPSGTDPWAGLSQPVQNMNSEYNYQQPQSNTGYGQQVNNTLQGSFNQARVPQTQSYVQPKNVPAAPERRVLSSQRPHVLRSVELVDTPITPRAPPVYPHQHKPITIMKDNFQGPTQYNVTGQTQLQGYQGQGQGQQPWGQQGQVQTKQLQYDKSYDERRLAMEAPKGKPQSHDYDKRRLSPQRGGRTISPGRRSPRNIQTNTRSDNYSERRVSPTRQFGDRHNTEFNNRHIESSKISAIDVSPIRKNSPSSRRISPSARKISPGRRISPSRKVSPRRISPFSRKISPTDRRRGSPNSRQVGTAGRRVSPTVDRRRVSPTVDRRRVSPTVDRRRVSPTGRRTSPTVDHRRVSPTGRRVSPTGRRVSPTGRRVSPTGRRVSPTGRRVSPTGRRVSPTGRRVSPTGRRVSPTGRRVSPIGRRVSPTGRRVSPSGRRISPGKRSSDRRVSPSMTKYDYYVEDERRMGGRVESPRRYSPKRSPVRGSARYSPSETKYDDSIIPNIKTAKPVRPAYESNQGQKYTGSGFRNETHYPAQNPRIEAKPSWQTEKITYHIKKEDRNTRMGRPDPIEKKLSPRRSRSRSPIKDRFRRHSPSPRSPRRSWALEKRRSPDAIREPPPPPLWPGQDPDETPTVIPVWETDVVEDRRFVNKREKYSPRFSPRRDSDRREYRDEKFERNYRNEERSDYRRESPRRDDKKLFNDVDKDFQDIYQRSVEFRLKTDELRKSNDRRNRPYDEDEPREEDAPRERTQKSKPTWIPVKLQTKEMDRNQQRLDPFVKEKRDKAVDEIANRMLVPHKFTSEQKERILGELKPSIFNIMMEMFKDKDVSYIELVIKFRARYDAKDEEKILLDVLDNFPNSYKNSLKRKGEGINEVSPKVVKYSPAYEKEEKSRPKLADAIIPDWSLPIEPPKVVVPMPSVAPPVIVPSPMYVPYQVPAMYQSLQANMQSVQTNMQPMQTNMQPMQPDIETNMHYMQSQTQANMAEIQARMQSHIQSNMQALMQPSSTSECYNLYLCQDDFEPFTENQAEKLKDFLVSQMFKASETGNGWAPDFALKGLHSSHRYELSTTDEASKDWIINLDFSEFEFFNVLVYTKEELWYERAAIWLPGHSRYRNIEPLEKLRLQNQYVEGINIGKWKYVKKIVIEKGTRLYVDMPPSSARALERQKMMLSYELGKVNVYLKAVAVDKEVFDAGLKAHSITEPSLLANVMQSAVMPNLPSQQVGVVKVTLNGAKSITTQQAGKIKEMIVYNLFKYHQQEGRSRTDFLKYGFCPPNCFGIIPENNESKRWLIGRSFGKLNRQVIVVLDGEDANTKYFRMRVMVPLFIHCQNTLAFMERLKTSNQGVKGLNFHFWKPAVLPLKHHNQKTIMDVDVDLESVETLFKMNFTLDFVSDNKVTMAAKFVSDYSLQNLEDKIRKYKSEQVDSYVVANMDLDSDSD